MTRKAQKELFIRDNQERDRLLAPTGMMRRPFESDGGWFFRVAGEWKRRAEAAQAEARFWKNQADFWSRRYGATRDAAYAVLDRYDDDPISGLAEPMERLRDVAGDRRLLDG